MVVIKYKEGECSVKDFLFPVFKAVPMKIVRKKQTRTSGYSWN